MASDPRIGSELSKALMSRQKLDSQSRETELVINELNLLTDDEKIFKSFGPALLVQEKDEALANLKKRGDFINGEIKNLDKTIENLKAKARK